MSYEAICQKNPLLQIDRVYDVSFSAFGRVVKYEGDMDHLIKTTELCAPKLEDININCHRASVEQIEAIPDVQNVLWDVFGGMPASAGLRRGTNVELDSLEFHKGGEVLFACTDILIVLGMVQDIISNSYNNALAKIFYLEKGTMVELFGTTMHSKPMRVNESYLTVGMTLKGTNDPLLPEEHKGMLVRRNKWIIVHPTSEHGAIAGDYPGLRGRMISVNPLV